MPVANFTYTVSGLTVNFSDNSQDALGYSWHFGDGNTSNQQNPTHTYTAPGSYNVCLIVENECGQDEYCVTVNVGQSCDPPIAVDDIVDLCVDADPTGANQNFATIDVLTNDSYIVPCTVTVVNGPLHGTVSQPSPGSGTLIYSPFPGFIGTDVIEYQVCDSCGCSRARVIINVNQQPIAFFAYASASTTVSFQNGSLNATNWIWDLGDGTISTDWEPTHTYANPGIYTVCLLVENECGIDSFCQTIEIEQACDDPIAVEDFVTICIDPTTGAGSSTIIDVTVNDTPNANNYVVHALSMPSHGTLLIPSNNTGIFTYIPIPGFVGWDSFTYELCTQCGCSSTTVNIFVGEAPQVDFTYASPSSNPLQVSFSSILGNSFVSGMVWDFGDNNTSTQSNPTHTYAAAGTYTVCLTAENECGATTVCHDVEVGQGCNDPMARNDQMTVCMQNGNRTINVLANDSYGSGATVNVISGPSNGTLTGVSASGVIGYTPAPGFTGLDSLIYQLCDLCGCSTATLYIYVQGMPDPTFTTAENGWTVDFFGVPQPGATWTWDFGDDTGVSTTNPNTTHTYNRPGEYTVCVTVVTACGAEEYCQELTICGRDRFENNDTQSAAANIGTRRALRAVICPVGDIDWYAVNVTQNRPNLKIRLYSLPANYDLSVYDAGGNLIGSSNTTGTNSEILLLNNLAPGTYFIKVEGVGGAYDPVNPYRLRVQSRNVPFNRTAAEDENDSDENVDIEFNEENDVEEISTTEITTPNFNEPKLTNYPNPFSDVTTIEYTLPEDATVSLSVYNVMGQEIVKLIESEEATAGVHTKSFDASQLTDGIYYCILHIGDKKITQKIVVSR